MVVLVLITSCHVSEKWKKGPVIAHRTMMSIAPIKAHFDPSQPEAKQQIARSDHFWSRSQSELKSFLLCLLYSWPSILAQETSKTTLWSAPFYLVCTLRSSVDLLGYARSFYLRLFTDVASNSGTLKYRVNSGTYVPIHKHLIVLYTTRSRDEGAYPIYFVPFCKSFGSCARVRIFGRITSQSTQ